MNIVEKPGGSKSESPKTPGGISKSLLTPCRRVGLSRKWKKSGSSPFVSPLTHSNLEQSTDIVKDKETKKRKHKIFNEEGEEKDNIKEKRESNSNLGELDASEIKCDNLVKTPVRHVELPLRKKSKKLSKQMDITNSYIHQIENEELVNENKIQTSNEMKLYESSNSSIIEKTNVHSINCTPVEDPIVSENINLKNISKEISPLTCRSSFQLVKEKSPNNLVQECMVVLQKNILSIDESENITPGNLKNLKHSKKSVQNSVTSQILFDSDSDDTPLCNLSTPKVNTCDINTNLLSLEINEDSLFTESKIAFDSKVKNLGDRKVTAAEGKNNLAKLNKEAKKLEIKEISKPQSQDSIHSFGNDEEDFDLDCKKTILIRKTYNKCAKPQKAKSTGSVTQKDIDDIKARIEMKKDMLLAKSLTKDTKELRDLIKRWRKGCQDALTELMDIMRKKFPEKHNMDYSELLEMLKIPSNLVGYDENHDCFDSPEEMDVFTF